MTTTDATDGGGGTADDDWRIVLNPVSGTGDHAERVRSLADARGFTVEATAEAGDAVELAREAAESGATKVAACGGDGTVHQVVEGLNRADALDDVTFGVVPAGTGNDFASNVGVTSVEQAFELLLTGERRQIDLGVADGEPFTNSCIAGLTAETSSATSSEMKEQFGTLAYVAAGLRTLTEFEPIHLAVHTQSAAGTEWTTWRGEALCILVGNARRFTEGGGQADIEDGLFEVTIVEDMPKRKMLSEGAIQRFVGGETENVTQLTSDELRVTGHEGEAIEFSLDGEIREHEELSMRVRPSALNLVVGESYDPDP